MQVRKASKPRFNLAFQFDNMTLEIVYKYKYIGLNIGDYLDYTETINELV